MMDFQDVVKARRSIRAYLPDIPAREVLDEIMDTARRAPSAGFSEGIDFLVIDDAAAIGVFREMTEHPDHPAPDAFKLHPPPVVVLVFSDPSRYLKRYSADDKSSFGLDDPDRWPVRFWDVDAAMAAMQLQLAAVNAGLATWFFGISFGEDEVRSHFNVPDDRNIVGVIGLGYRHPVEEPMGSATTRTRRQLAEQLHYNSW